MRRRLSLLVIGVCGTGCWPATGTLVPEIHGRVLDTEGNVVPNAAVEVRNSGTYGPRVVRKLTTAPDGTFHRSEETFWLLYVVPADVYGPRLTLAATADDAKSDLMPIGGYAGVRFFGLGPRRRVDVGNVILKPSADVLQPTTNPPN